MHACAGADAGDAVEIETLPESEGHMGTVFAGIAAVDGQRDAPESLAGHVVHLES